MTLADQILRAIADLVIGAVGFIYAGHVAAEWRRDRRANRRANQPKEQRL